MTAVDRFKQLVTGELRTGRARTHGALTLVPLFGALECPPYVLAAAAFEQGLVKIEELQAGRVPTLVVHNLANLPVLLVYGEHLEGAMQNRIVNASLLVGANSSLEIPVACVEEGRWHYEERPDFAPSRDFAHARLRSLQARATTESARAGRGRTSDQSAVWEHLATMRAESGMDDSPTGAMSDTYAERRGDVEELLAAFPAPEPQQTGVIACVGGRPLVLDAFDRPDSLARLWDRLLSGYAMDALGALAASVSEAVGGALAWDEGIAHASVFPLDEDDRGRPGRVDRRAAAASTRRAQRISSRRSDGRVY